ncbi:2-isopropylmalate synthase [Pelomyxa schiedti]|nr:2-isopropylmalate synthase [Pelomyxa schiedti]
MRLSALYQVCEQALTRQGERQFAEGKYTGDLLGAMRHGSGTMIFTNGSVYEGDWVKGKQHGQGKLTRSGLDGDQSHNIMGPGREAYSGLWVGGMKEGHGTHKWPDGSVYDGMWHRDKRHGQGVMQNKAKGYIYDGMGSWDNGKRSGHGIDTKANGDKYNGEWAAGKREGVGLMEWGETGEYYIGKWMNDMQAGNGEMRMKNGDVHMGEWVLGKMHGEGTVTREGSRHVFKGNFKEGMAEGSGVWTYNAAASGDFLTFNCGFVKGLRNGLGRFALKGDREIICHWVNDKPDPVRPNAVLMENELSSYCQWKPDGPDFMPVFHGKGASINVSTGEVTKFTYVDGVRQQRESTTDSRELDLGSSAKKYLKELKTELQQIKSDSAHTLQHIQRGTPAAC